MLYKTLSLALIVCGFMNANAQSDEDILQKTISKLNSLETIEYTTTTYYFFEKMGYDKHDTVVCFFDFRSNDTLIGAKFQFEYNMAEAVFTGNSLFMLRLEQELITHGTNPSKRKVVSYLMHSIYTVRKLLPEIVKDTAIVINKEQDTLVNEIDSYNFKLTFKNGKNFGLDGELKSNSKHIKPLFYNLYISKESYMPTQFTLSDPENNNKYEANFTDYNLAATRDSSTWGYDRFDERYLRMSFKDYFMSFRAKANAQVGKLAPDWTLPKVSGDSVSLSKLENKLTLLEFWFPGCSPCIRAIPEINEIQKSYAEKGLEVYGIEFTKSADKLDVLQQYVEKHNVQIPTLFAGKEVAQQYGVNVAPTFFLIDQKGTIKYSSLGYREGELKKAIEKELQE
ncbi:peroxiredoxin family protein [Flammeovirgaceae bacterium SG7u.111]|nr:peroxiredoxin family protein [Flammeovirgaceae bacterium SG7u.132]WPO36537.1 peroxiredoxin family protein [Flammeovirgaceae bacterium SG7u.111]